METITETCVVETPAGALRGRIETPGSGVDVFKGVNYGADTATARFEPPRPPAPCTRLGDAFARGGPPPPLDGRPRRVRLRGHVAPAPRAPAGAARPAPIRGLPRAQRVGAGSGGRG